MKLIVTIMVAAAVLLAGCGGGSSTDTEVANAVQTYKHWKRLDQRADEFGSPAVKAKASRVWKEVLAFSYPVQEAMAEQLKSERK